HGVLIGQKSLHPLLRAMTVELVKTIDLDHEIDPVPDKGAGLVCPTCARGMENHPYMGTNLVRIDTCYSCRQVWLDTDEVGTMSLLYARTSRQEEWFEEASRERLRELRAVPGLAGTCDASVEVTHYLVLGFIASRLL
ncbi:MAG: zf-TFIIB domain-containing protein, partial [Planctomycetes bacterium]|nr:zf-TFIIB domain-containing protein [Planctomycetota bacterium]